MAKEKITKNKQTKKYGNAADSITVTGSSNKISTMGGTDRITLSKGKKNTVDAGAGNDTVTVAGGSGNTIKGGKGKDTFVIGKKSKGSAVIKDYTAGQDILKVTGGTVTKATLSKKNIKFTAEKAKITLANAKGKTISLQDSRGSYAMSSSAITLGKDFAGTMNAGAYLSSITKIDGSKAVKALTLTGGSRVKTIYTGSGADKINSSGGTVSVNAGAGADTITVNGGNNHTLRGGTGSDKYVINSVFSAGTRLTVNQTDYRAKDADVLQLTNVNKDDVSYDLRNGTLTINHKSGGAVTVSGWSQNPFSKIVFKNGTVTGAAVTQQAVTVVNASKTYYAGESGAIFRFQGAGWNAKLSGTGSKNRLDFSQYTDGEYGSNLSQSGNDLIIRFVKYDGEAETPVGTVTIQGYFAKSDRVSRLTRYNFAARAVQTANLIVGGNNDVAVKGTSGSDWIVTGNGNKTVYAGAGNDLIQVGWGDAGAEGIQTVNGGAGNDTCIVCWPLRNIATAPGDSYCVAVDNTSAADADFDTLTVQGANSTDFRFYISSANNTDLVIQNNDTGDSIVVYGWADHGFRKSAEDAAAITFDDKSVTNDEIYATLANTDHTVFIDKDGAYEASQWNDIFTFRGSGWNATVAGADGNDRLDFSQLEGVDKDNVQYARDDRDLLITTGSGTVRVSGWHGSPFAEVLFAGDESVTAAEINAQLPPFVTQQSVIKRFMKSLDNNPALVTADVDDNATEDEINAAINAAINDATAVLDVAVNYASDGKYATWSALTESFISDVSNHGLKDDNSAADYTYTSVDEFHHATGIVPESGLDRFLKDYCGIDLTNEDTGSITGADAGGAAVKTAISIVPENGTVTDLQSPESGTTTINGLTIEWPDPGDDATKQYIVKSLSTWWAEEGLNLVEEAFGLSFTEDGVTGRDMTVKFVEENEDFLARVQSGYSYGYTLSNTGEKIFTSEETTLIMQINMNYFNSVDTEGVDGYAAEYNSYLDRTVAHEFTHAIMAATMERVYGGGWLPLYVTEGLAELVHGIDDIRTIDIIGLASSANTEYLTQVLQPNVNAGGDSYAAGYMLFRYLAKQVADSANSQAANASPDVAATVPSGVSGTLVSSSAMLLSDCVAVSSDYGESPLAMVSIRNSLIDFTDTGISGSLNGTQEEDKQNSSLFVTGNV